jgi:hypothetical protein
MAVSLIKKNFLALPTARPIPVMTDTLPNHFEIACPHCPQQFTFDHSNGEEHRLKGWLEIAKREMAKNHRGGHKLMAVPLAGIPRSY